MKTLLFIALFFAFSFHTQAQKQDIPAYLVTLKGDTLRGTAYSYSEHESAEKFVFRSNGTDKYQTYSPADIWAYGILDDQKAVYVVKNIPVFQKNQRFFCRQVWRSCTNLYMIEKMPMDEVYAFWARENGDVPKKLMRKVKEYKDAFILENKETVLIRLNKKSFAPALKSMFEDCPQIASRSHKFDLAYLKKIVMDYDSCKNCVGGKDLMSIDLALQKQKKAFYFGAVGGLGINTVTNLSSGSSSPFKPIFFLGGFLGVKLGSRFAVQAELMYSQRNILVERSGGFNSEIKKNYFQANFLFRYYFTRFSTKPFISAGFGTQLPVHSLDNLFENYNSINQSLGLGMTVMKTEKYDINAEIRYNQYSVTSLSSSIALKGIEFFLSYSFGKN